MYTKLNIIYILIFLVTLFVSCTDDSEIKDFPSNKESEVKSLWTFPETVDVGFSGKHTRISYTDNGTQGIKQNWESGDQFILYNTSGESVTYTISEIDSSDSSVATFELNSDQTALEGNVFYAVYDNGNVNVTFSNELPIYNLATTGQTQNGADSNVLSHLKNYDLITTGAIDDIDQDIEFSSDGVLLTFSLSNISTDFGAPKSLQIEIIGTPENVFSTNYNVDGDTTLFKLNLEGYDSLTTSLNAYMLIPPFVIPAGCNMSVLLESNSNRLRYSSKFNSEKTYTEAVRYNFPITSFTKFDLYTYAMDQINAYYDDGWGTKYKPTTGDGSSGNPYLIETAWNLAWVKAITTNNTNYNNPDVYYKLTTNIYISDTLSWKPIGQTSEFKANFDGGGNEIINMIITDKYSHVGLFGFTNGATISNLIAKGSITAVTSGGSFFGGIIGQATNTTISNCNNYVDMSNPQGGSTGGIIGQGLGSVVIKDCNNYGVINGYEFTGGIIGQYNSYESGALITGCNNFNFITGSRKEIGGIVGFANSNQLPINYCSNYGNVTGTSQASDIGGIVGSGYANTITYCYNSGTITGYTYTGTIIGDNLGGTLSNTNANTGLANGTGSMVGTH